MPKNEEKQPLIDKDDPNKTTDYSAEGENLAGGKKKICFTFVSKLA